ncbi:MAG TPA: globin [Symbiobacteriaceae bacterium]|nr:globin [Symbiobacteriaceae bacterium]
MITQTLYERMGGAETIRRLVDAFYPRVVEDPHIKHLFPADITPVMEKQYLFLTQFFGGPTLYNQVHGHPMLRMRHMPFPIGRQQAIAWLGCMTLALQDAGLSDELREEALARLTVAAQHMINQEGAPE